MAIGTTDLERNVQSLELGDSILPVTHIIINYGTDTNGTTLTKEAIASTDNGRTVELTLSTITDGSTVQTIANNLLTRYANDQHSYITASGTELSPLMELGDAIEVDGEYSDIGNITTSFSKAMYADVLSQGVTEEDDFPYLSNVVNKTERELSTVKTAINVQAGRITSEISTREGEYIELGTRIDQRLDSISLTVSGTDGTTSFVLKDGTTTLDTETFDLHVKSVNVEGTITADTVKSSWVYAGAINANQVTAGTFNLGSGYGYIGQGTGSGGGGSTTTGVIMSSYGSGSSGLGDSDYYFIVTDSGTRMTGGGAHVVCINGRLTLQGVAGGYKLNLFTNALVPSADNAIALGYSSTAYKASYSYDWIEVSDREKKENINYDVSEYRALFDKLKPCSFNYISTDETKLTKTGLIAQDIETAMEEISMPMAKFNGLRFDYDEETHTKSNYSLCYNDFISMLVDQVQMLKARVVQLEANIN